MNETHSLYKRCFLNQLKSHLTDSAGSYITTLCKNQGNANPNSALRFPLQLALLISPICLLLPVNLHKKSFNRGALMQWSNRFRSHKPDVLQLTEKKLWRAILNIVNHPADYLMILKNLASEFPSKYVEELRREEKTMNDWFEIKNFDIPSNAIQNSQAWNADNQTSSSLHSVSLSSSSFLQPTENKDLRIFVDLPFVSVQ